MAGSPPPPAGLPTFLRPRKLLKPSSPLVEKPKVQRPRRPVRPATEGDSGTLWLSYGVNLYERGEAKEGTEWVEKYASQSKRALGVAFACSLLTKWTYEAAKKAPELLPQARQWSAQALSPSLDSDLHLPLLVNTGIIAYIQGDPSVSSLQAQAVSLCSSLLGLTQTFKSPCRPLIRGLAETLLGSLRPNQSLFSTLSVQSLNVYLPELQVWVRPGVYPPRAEVVKVTSAVAAGNQRMDDHISHILGQLGHFASDD